MLCPSSVWIASHELRLGQLAPEPAKLAFEVSQLSKFLPERHCNL